MNTQELLKLIKTSPTEVEFEQVIKVVDRDYEYTPTQFYNGIGQDEIINGAGKNEGSCKIFSFADINDLNEAQTLACFGQFYRKEVLLDLAGNSHANIRNFMKFGWEGIHFDNPPLNIKK